MPRSTTPVIGFIDIDSYECQLWQRDYPNCRGQPCVVANISGRILSVTHEAKRLGVSRTATPNIRQAREVCPTLRVFTKPNVWGKPDSKKTRNGTWEVLDTIREFCAKRALGNDIIVELASSDELYLDISSEVTRAMERVLKTKKFISISSDIVHENGRRSKQGPFIYNLKTETPGKKAHWEYMLQDESRIALGSLFMRDVCHYLYEKIQLSASAGVGSNKLLAKVGCGLNKPGKVTIFHEDAIKRVGAQIPINNIPGLGGETGEKLMKNFDIKMVSELKLISLEKLENLFDSELGQKIFSWARGKDNQPVIEQFMKDRFTCNKPNSDVTSMNHLQKVIRNLCAEVLERLEEEKIRHERIANQVTFGFTFVTSGGGVESDNLVLDVSNECKRRELPETATNSILGHKSFSESKFKIQKLKLVIQDFEPLNPMDALSQAVNEKLLLIDTETVAKKELPVHTKSDPRLAPTFSNRKHIGSFRTTSEQGYSSSDVNIPKLIPLDQLLRFRGLYLGRGYEEATKTTMITDHTSYYELKHHCFIQWLREVKFMENVEAGKFKKPDFIGFGGRFTDPMRSPAIKQFGDWEIYAINVGGIVYLWDEKKPQRANTIESYYGTNFERIATMDSHDTTPNEYEMPYVVTEVSLAQHQLLVVSNIDAVDENGEWTEVAVWKNTMKNHNAKAAKMVKAWTQSAVNGVQQLVLGSRNNEGVLEDVEVKSLDDLSKSLGDSTSKCMYFQNQFLSFIKTHLPESNRCIVKKFSWVCGNRNVSCADVQQQGIPHLVFPRLYSSYLNQTQRSDIL